MRRAPVSLPPGGKAPLLLLAAAILGASCAATPKPISLSAPAKAPTSKNYPSVLEATTRFGSILRELDTTLRIYATLRTPRFDAAYVAKYAEMFDLPADKRAKLATERRTAWQKQLSFVVVAATHDASWNDFEQRRSQWRLSLENDAGKQVDPTAISLVRRPNETDRALFPHLKMFFRLYRVTFPRQLPGGEPLIGSSTKRLVLRAAGALGKTELVWRLR